MKNTPSRKGKAAARTSRAFKAVADGSHDNIGIDRETEAIDPSLTMMSDRDQWKAAQRICVNMMNPNEYNFFIRFWIREFCELPLSESDAKRLKEVEEEIADYNQGEEWKKGNAI